MKTTPPLPDGWIAFTDAWKKSHAVTELTPEQAKKLMLDYLGRRRNE